MQADRLLRMVIAVSVVLAAVSFTPTMAAASHDCDEDQEDPPRHAPAAPSEDDHCEDDDDGRTAATPPGGEESDPLDGPLAPDPVERLAKTLGCFVAGEAIDGPLIGLGAALICEAAPDP